MEGQPRRRRRPALSCLECRRRKVKCDKTSPCAHCVAAHIHCTYRTYHDEPSSFRQSTSSSAPATPIPLAREPPSSARSQQPATNGALDDGGAPVAPRANALETFGSVGEEQDDVDPRRMLRQLHSLQQTLEAAWGLNSLAGSSGPGGKATNNTALVLANPSKVKLLHKSRMIRWNVALYLSIFTTHEFATLRDCFIASYREGRTDAFSDSEIRALFAQALSLMKKCKELAQSMKMGRPGRSLNYSLPPLVPPARSVADAMASLYIDSFESAFRILHVPSFWAEYHKFWGDPENAPDHIRLKVHLVIGIGSSLHEKEVSDPELRAQVRQWIYTAQVWLAGPLEKNRLNIAGIQIHCLLLLARQLFSVGGDLVWLSAGSLLTEAMESGLHRDPSNLGHMSLLEAEVRRRLWATVLEMAIQTSLDASGVPPFASLDEFETAPPSNVNDDELDASTTALQPRPKEVYTSASLQRLLLESLPMRLRIVRLLNSIRAELSYPSILALSAELAKACSVCASFTREHVQAGRISTFHRALLDYLVRRFMLPLHGAFAMQARRNQLFYYSLKTAVDVALVLMEPPEPDARFVRLMSTAGGLFKEALCSAVPIVGIELIAQLQAEQDEGILQQGSSYRERLKKATRHLTVLCEERVRQGETNVKTYMFLRMMTAYGEAIEQGVRCELQVGRAAKDCLELCYELIRAQAGSVLAEQGTAPMMGLEKDRRANGLDSEFNLDCVDFSSFALSFFLPDVGYV